MEDFLLFIASLIACFMIGYGINHILKEDKEWHDRCHYEYVDDLGNSGMAFECYDSFGQLTCDIEEEKESTTHVISYKAICDEDEKN